MVGNLEKKKIALLPKPRTEESSILRIGHKETKIEEKGGGLESGESQRTESRGGGRCPFEFDEKKGQKNLPNSSRATTRKSPLGV